MNTERIDISDDSHLKPDLSDSHSAEKPAEEKSDRPSWLPEKFSNAEELAKSYSELEKKVSQEKTADVTQEAIEDNKQAAEKATGLNLNSYYDEYAEKGELSEKTYEDLAKSGLSKDLVDSYIKGQKAIADQTTQAAYNSVGGQESYQKMMEWATKTLPEAEIKTFNKTMDSGDANQVHLAIQGMNARYKETNFSEPNLLKGEAAPATDVFRSTAEIVRAMQDPRYKEDTAYQKDVAAKLDRSDVY
jgi:hypothetical protein